MLNKRDNWVQVMIFIFIVSIGLNGYLLGRYPQNKNVNTLNKVESENKNVNTLNKVENENSIFNTIGPIVYYADYDTVRLIETEEYSAIEVQKLPESLVISSGYYQYKDAVYHLEQEGLYRFVYPQAENQQRIVYNHKNTDRFISAIAWIVSHGNVDNYQTVCPQRLLDKYSEILMEAF